MGASHCKLDALLAERNSDYIAQRPKLRVVTGVCLMKIKLQQEFTVAVAAGLTHQKTVCPASDWKRQMEEPAASLRGARLVCCLWRSLLL